MSGGPEVLFRDLLSSLDICIMCDTPNRPVKNTHYCQPATEEWMHLTALWGNVKRIKKIENCLSRGLDVQHLTI